MSGLVQFAKAELRAAGMFDADADYNGEIAPLVVSLMETFAAYGQSGGTAALAMETFTRLAAFKPLSPLTGEDAEWTEVAEEEGQPLLQNKRCSTVFSCGAKSWIIDESGERTPITFPYTVA